MNMTLITAILMTLASVAWFASALIVPDVGETSITRWLVVVIFTVLAVIYWTMFFRKRKANAHSQKSGTE